MPQDVPLTEGVGSARPALTSALPTDLHCTRPDMLSLRYNSGDSELNEVLNTPTRKSLFQLDSFCAACVGYSSKPRTRNRSTNYDEDGVDHITGRDLVCNVGDFELARLPNPLVGGPIDRLHARTDDIALIIQVHCGETVDCHCDLLSVQAAGHQLPNA